MERTEWTKIRGKNEIIEIHATISPSRESSNLSEGRLFLDIAWMVFAQATVCGRYAREFEQKHPGVCASHRPQFLIKLAIRQGELIYVGLFDCE